jgi:hypothetical protein
MRPREELIEAMGLAIADVDGLGRQYIKGVPDLQRSYFRMATAALAAIEARAIIVPKEFKNHIPAPPEKSD